MHELRHGNVPVKHWRFELHQLRARSLDCYPRRSRVHLIAEPNHAPNSISYSPPNSQANEEANTATNHAPNEQADTQADAFPNFETD